MRLRGPGLVVLALSVALVVVMSRVESPSAAPASYPAPYRLYLPLVLNAWHPGMPTPTLAPPTMAPKPTAAPLPTPSVTPSPSPTGTVTPVPQPDPRVVVDYMDGQGLIYSYDATTFLGRVSSNCFLSDSIVNDFGDYGSPYSATSIRNSFGTYGSPYSDKSAFNVYATQPPIAWMPDASGGYYPFVYVTTNPYKLPRSDSTFLIAYLDLKGSCP